MFVSGGLLFQKLLSGQAAQTDRRTHTPDRLLYTDHKLRRLRACVHTAFRIHISSETKDKLDLLGGYHTRYRGEVELKVTNSLVCHTHTVSLL